MAFSGGDFERIIALGEAAFERIRAFLHPPFPRIYEFWYAYVSGLSPRLNEAVNEILDTRGNLTEREVEALFEVHLSPMRSSARLDEVGDKVRAELDRVMGAVGAARVTSEQYGESLETLSTSIADSLDRDTLKHVIRSLLDETRKMQDSNRDLESQLESSRQEMVALHDRLEAIRNESFTDPLTTLANRKYFHLALDRALGNFVEQGETFSLLVTDIDHFKSFNDRFGHLTGDQVLRLVANEVKQNVKGQDVAARYGGEEFAIILPATTLEDAAIVADHIRRAVMSKELVKRSTGENLGRVTVSVGVATHKQGDTASSIIERADKCLYAAKGAGRNRVVTETDLDALSDRVA